MAWEATPLDNFTPIIKLEHSDSRGEIYSITLPGDKELMLLHSKAGSLRGGHAHDVDEIVVMLTGRMRYHKRSEDGGEWQDEVKGGDTSFNQVGEYHMGEALEDLWLLEWKIGTDKTGWKNIDYAPWREKVRGNMGVKA